jgi:YHS domain-containing protein
MKRLIICIAVLCLLSSALANADSGNVDKRETVCVVRDTVGTAAGVPHEYNGKTYYLCCKMCRESIQNEPKKYTIATDPVSGKQVDKAEAFIYNLEGKAYYFESEANRKSFAANPAKYIKE